MGLVGLHVRVADLHPDAMIQMHTHDTYSCTLWHVSEMRLTTGGVWRAAGATGAIGSMACQS